MTIGILVGGVTITPDKNIQVKVSFKPRKEMVNNLQVRAPATSINRKREDFVISFNNRSKEVVDDLMDFFSGKGATTSFPITIPEASGTERTIQVVCTDFSQNINTIEGAYSCNAKLRKVYTL